MRADRIRTLVGAALGFAMLVPVLFQPGCSDQQQSISGPPLEPVWLTIVTPHNERIRQVFEEAFNEWHQKQRNTSVYFNWLVYGTPECLSYIESARGSTHRGGRSGRPDLLFGGGIEDHAQLADASLSQSFVLTEAELEGIPATIAGRPTRDEQSRWHATSVSSFGILVNLDRMEQWGLKPPTTWSDLARPEYRGWLAIADPARSGSNRQAMVLILNKYGWEKGWSLIVRMLANARALSDRSSVALHQVDTGLALAAPAVSFDGMTLAAESGGRLTYLNPAGATSVSPGAVSLLQRASSGNTAKDFVRFCLSDAGQKLWALEGEHRKDQGATLYHYPIRPSIITDHADHLALQDNPFKTDFGIEIDLPKSRQQREALVPLVQALCAENHVLLQRAWTAVIDAGMPEAAVAELTAVPFSEAEAFERGREFALASKAEQDQALAGWSRLFRERLQRVIELVRE